MRVFKQARGCRRCSSSRASGLPVPSSSSVRPPAASSKSLWRSATRARVIPLRYSARDWVGTDGVSQQPLRRLALFHRKNALGRAGSREKPCVSCSILMPRPRTVPCAIIKIHHEQSYERQPRGDEYRWRATPASGATVGGVLFDMSGYRATFQMSAGLLFIAAVLAVLAARAGARAISSLASRSV